MRAMLERMFMGRNGIDQLNTAVLGVGLVCWAASMFVPVRGLQTILYYAFVLAAGVCIYRALSRNIAKRQEENRKFLQKTGRFRNSKESWQNKAEQKRQFKIFKCPACGVKLRVPRGKGKIRVTCRQFGATFEEKS